MTEQEPIRVAIVGCGRLGCAIAGKLVEKENQIKEIALTSRIGEDSSKGVDKAMGLMKSLKESRPRKHFPVIDWEDLSPLREYDLILVTAGCGSQSVNIKEYIRGNIGIPEHVGPQLTDAKGLVVYVTNPTDIIAHLGAIYQRTESPFSVVGYNHLDLLRFTEAINQKAREIHPALGRDVEVFIAGPHVPNGLPLISPFLKEAAEMSELFKKLRSNLLQEFNASIGARIEMIRDMGEKISTMPQTAESIQSLIDAFFDPQKIVQLSIPMRFGDSLFYCGWPCTISRKRRAVPFGIEITEHEADALEKIIRKAYREAREEKQREIQVLEDEGDRWKNCMEFIPSLPFSKEMKGRTVINVPSLETLIEHKPGASIIEITTSARAIRYFEEHTSLFIATYDGRIIHTPLDYTFPSKCFKGAGYGGKEIGISRLKGFSRDSTDYLVAGEGTSVHILRVHAKGLVKEESLEMPIEFKSAAHDRIRKVDVWCDGINTYILAMTKKDICIWKDSRMVQHLSDRTELHSSCFFPSKGKLEIYFGGQNGLYSLEVGNPVSASHSQSPTIDLAYAADDHTKGIIWVDEKEIHLPPPTNKRISHGIHPKRISYESPYLALTTEFPYIPVLDISQPHIEPVCFYPYAKAKNSRFKEVLICRDASRYFLLSSTDGNVENEVIIHAIQPDLEHTPLIRIPVDGRITGLWIV